MAHTTDLGPIFFILGSTGTGKSSFAVELATFLKETNRYRNVVIINCDVMQFYTDLPVATNKITFHDMKKIPHAFLGFLNCDDTYLFDPVQAFFSSEGCNTAIPQKISSNGRFDIRCYVDKVVEFLDRYFESYKNSAVIICGGTYYYAQGILFDNTLVPEGGDKAICNLSDDSNDEDGLWDRLNRMDAQVACRYHPNDKRRLKRLLQIYKTTKMLPSEVYSSKNIKLRFSKERTFVLSLWLDRRQLYESLNTRVDTMVSKNLLSEVEEFLNRNEGRPLNTSIMAAIGLKEFKNLFNHKDRSSKDFQRLLEARIEQVKFNTRRYARQQEQWLGNRIQALLVGLGDQFISHHFMKIDASQLKASGSLAELVQALFSKEPQPFPYVDYLHNDSAEAKKPVSQEFCDVCSMIVYGRGQWQSHVFSKRHRAALKRKSIEARFKETFGKDLPPPKRRKV